MNAYGMMNIGRVLRMYFRQSTRYMRYAARCATRPEIITIHGVRFPIPRGASESYRRSLYMERHERRLALMVSASLHPGDTVLEMGAGCGVISALCGKYVRDGKVYAYEANSALIPFIKRVYALNRVNPVLVNAAVGTSRGAVTFHVGDRTDSSSLIFSGEPGAPVSVQQEDASRIMDEIKPTFLVVDIEGSERDVLKNADLNGVRAIALELHFNTLGEQGSADLVEYLVSKGFKQHGWLSTRSRKLFIRRY